MKHDWGLFNKGELHIQLVTTIQIDIWGLKSNCI